LRVTAQQQRKKSASKWAPWLVVAIPVAAGIIYLLIWYGPDVIARHDIGNVTGPLRVLRLQQARDAARGRLLTLGAGLFAAGALIFTARNSLFAQRTVQLTEEGQVTDRYTKAIGQLGSEKLDVRIGGIYALERVASDSARDHPTVMEVLAAFIREHSREQWPPASSVQPGAELSGRTTRPDVQAALTVIGRRNTRQDRQPIDLTRANLTRANLTNADLTNADLTRATLADANLTCANLTGATLTGANLTGATLTDATLTGAVLADANLTGANLTRAILDAVLADATLTGATLINAKLPGAVLLRADFTGANLTGADLTRALPIRANLTGADLTDADLTDALLASANLTDAKLSKWVPVPKGWARDSSSGQLKPANADGHDSDK
jgi:uncharacterized protein YjbI with pentapeptide repeats